MKKLLAICLALSLVMCMGITAFAAGSFVSSPSGNKAPEIIGTDNKDEDCSSDVVITPYGDRDDLSEEERKAMEEVYEQILGTDDLGTLDEAFKKAAEEAGVDPSSLMVVSELFDVSIEGCTDHSMHGAFDVTIRPTTLDNFVSLLAFENGKWSIVKGLKLDKSNGQITFTAEKFGPYALVLSKEASSPKTSDNATSVALPIIALISAFGVAVLAKTKKLEA